MQLEISIANLSNGWELVYHIGNEYPMAKNTFSSRALPEWNIYFVLFIEIDGEDSCELES